MRRLANAPWETVYLHTGGAYKQDPDLAKIVQKVVDASWDAAARDLASRAPINYSEVNNLALGPLVRCLGDVVGRFRRPDTALRVCELHTVEATGALPNPNHFDGGSIMTIDVMLSRPGVDFEGGDFCTPEAGKEGQNSLKCYSFDQGDALLFLSHKPHCVLPVTGGTRQVLVIEQWWGNERSCGHRCDKHWGPCGHTKFSAAMERLLGSNDADP